MVEATVIDVIENFFGDVPGPGDATRLTRDQVEELGAMAVQSASAHEPVPEGDEQPVYAGGFWPAFWTESAFRPELYGALLYQSRVLVHDPLADYFGLSSLDELPELHSLRGTFANGDPAVMVSGPRAWAAGMTYAGDREHGPSAAAMVDRMIQGLINLAPLIRSGDVVARSQWPALRGRQKQILTSSRHDVRNPDMIAAAGAVGDPPAVWDNLRGMKVTPNGGIHPADEPWRWQPEFFYLAKTLAFADAAGAVYSPTNTGDRRLLTAKLGTLERDLPASLLTEVARFLVPAFDLEPKVWVAVRESEASFADWRLQLRDLGRESVGLDDVEVRQLVADRLGPLVEEVKQATSRSSVLKAGAREGLSRVVVEASIGASVAQAGGASPTIGASVGLAGVVLWLWNAYGPRPPLEGRRRVIAGITSGARQ
jgi:hypothetical protein